MWRASFTLASFLSDNIRARDLLFMKVQNGKAAQEPRWRECVAVTSYYMPIAVSALYVRQHFRGDSKTVAIEMFKKIRKEFKSLLETVSWMDDGTRAAALCKLDKFSSHIGHPRELLDDQKLTEFYRDVEIDEDGFLKSILNLKRFQRINDMRKLREPVNKTDWETHSDVAIANAHYSPQQNSDQMPAGILQGQFFSVDRPRYMNYASIGSMYGHGARFR